MGKVIYSDALMTWFNDHYDYDEDVSVACVLGAIAEQPEAVVRCCDCVYWDTQDQTANMIAKCNYYSAERYCVYTNSKDYCSGGERKTDE